MVVFVFPPEFQKFWIGISPSKAVNLNKGLLKYKQNEAKVIYISQMHCLICSLQN